MFSCIKVEQTPKQQSEQLHIMPKIDDSIFALAEHPNAYAKRFKVTADDLDGFGHVNNAVYLKWLDATVWEDTRRVGVDEATCQALNRGMAVVRHEIDYIASAYLDDDIVVFNWLTGNDGRLRAERIFQVVRLGDQKTILRAHTQYICTNLETGRPTRMPDVFVSAYKDTLNQTTTTN